MFSNSDVTATLAFLDKVDSAFYLQIFSFKLSVKQINEEISSIMDKVEGFKLCPPSQVSITSQSVHKPFDGSSLERWRLPNLQGTLATTWAKASFQHLEI